MFNSCKLELLQRDPFNSTKRVLVKLLRPVAGGGGRNGEPTGALVQSFAEGFNWSGAWRPFDSNVSIGSFAMQEDGVQFWRYSAARGVLEFVERETRSSESGEYLSKPVVLRRVAVLWGAKWTPRGIEPKGDLEEAMGELLWDTRYFLQRGLIFWRYEQF